MADADDYDWTLDAKCRGMPPSIFVPDGPGGSMEPAKDICNGRDGRPECPVKSECLAYGEATNSIGVFGGIMRSSKTWRATSRKRELYTTEVQNVVPRQKSP